MKRLPLPLLAMLVALSACKKDPALVPPSDPVAEYLSLPETPFNYALPELPAHLMAANIMNADNTPFNNPVTDHGATLGRVLFFDKNLSKNNTIACASCHRQDRGFTDDATLSAGFEGGLTGRHSMRLANARFYNPGSFFWDQRAGTLEAQVLMPIQDEVEMGLTLNTLIERLMKLPYYAPLFKNAFGTEEINAQRVSYALAQYVRSLVSYRSRFDEGRAQVPTPLDPFPNFTQQENLGKNIFFSPALGNCAPCHGTDAFIAPGPLNNGLEVPAVDEGFGGVTNNPAQVGLFKAPSLRNVAVAGPYMHDGRFATLMEVVQHYSNGVQDHPNLSPPLRLPGGGVRQANLNQNQMQALVAFMLTLTDLPMLEDEKFSNPFKNP